MGAVVFEAPRLLAPEDDLSHFSSGLEIVDTWAQKWAKRAMETNTARVYIVQSAGHIAGFYSLSTHAIRREQGIAGALRRNAPDPIPCTLLGMLGVDADYQGMGLGWSLLQDAIKRAKQASSVVASRALVIDPATDEAAGFYKKFGFRSLGDSARLFMKL